MVSICKRKERYKTIRFQENANRKIRDYKINEFLKFLFFFLWLSLPPVDGQASVEENRELETLFCDLTRLLKKEKERVPWQGFED